MFNEGEIGIFQRLGMSPVFFGQTIIGRNQPNLVYMLAFDDMAHRERAWKGIRQRSGVAEDASDAGLPGSRHRVEHHELHRVAAAVFSDSLNGAGVAAPVAHSDHFVVGRLAETNVAAGLHSR